MVNTLCASLLTVTSAGWGWPLFQITVRFPLSFTSSVSIYWEVSVLNFNPWIGKNKLHKALLAKLARTQLYFVEHTESCQERSAICVPTSEDVIANRWPTWSSNNAEELNMCILKLESDTNSLPVWQGTAHACRGPFLLLQRKKEEIKRGSWPSALRILSKLVPTREKKGFCPVI